jgi:hypothetical protein
MRENIRDTAFGHRKPPSSPGTFEIKLKRLQEDIVDLEKCLAGNAASNMWQLVQIDLFRKRDELNSTVERVSKTCIPGNELIKDPSSGFWMVPPK